MTNDKPHVYHRSPTPGIEIRPETVVINEIFISVHLACSLLPGLLASARRSADGHGLAIADIQTISPKLMLEPSIQTYTIDEYLNNVLSSGSLHSNRHPS